MDDEYPKHKTVATVFLVQQTLGVAERLLALAEVSQTEKDGQYLAGCSITLQVAALDQGTDALIMNLSTNFAVRHNVRTDAVPFVGMRRDSLWDRVIVLPRLMSNGAYHFNMTSIAAARILRGIELRHRLLHIRDQHIIINSESGRNGITSQIEDGYMLVRMPIPEFLWDKVTLHLARETIEAVSKYVDSVMLLGATPPQPDTDLLKKALQKADSYENIYSSICRAQMDIDMSAWPKDI